MNKKTKQMPVNREEILRVFSKVDEELKKRNQKLSVTTLGGVSIILQGIRDRATLDIDIVPNQDAVLFQKICLRIGIPVDIVTVASTVDFHHAPTLELFQGKKLSVHSITPQDLIKLKLERFRKQDPEDIYAIIEKSNFSYKDFKALIKDMLPDFIGNTKELLLSAWLVVDRQYPGQSSDFKFFFDIII